MRDGSRTRKKIHSAALSLFVDRGVKGTSVRDLTSAAGIAEGTLYRHYSSKDELVSDLFAINYTSFARRLQVLCQGVSDFGARADAIVAEVCRFYDEDPILFRFLLLVQHQGLPRMKDGPDNPFSVVERMMEEAIRNEEIGIADATLATSMLFGLILQPATAAVYGRLASPLSSHARDIASACKRALGWSGADDA